MVLFKSLLQAGVIAALLYFFTLYAQAQGMDVFTPAFFTLGGIFITVIFILLNFTLMWNWE
ncbi:MAG: hypothetical protein WC602_04080 [archaeon]